MDLKISNASLATSVEHDGGHYETRQVAKSLLGKIKRELERAKR